MQARLVLWPEELWLALVEDHLGVAVHPMKEQVQEGEEPQ